MNTSKQPKAAAKKVAKPESRYRSAETHMAILWALCVRPAGMTAKEIHKELIDQDVSTCSERNVQMIMKHLADRSPNIEVGRDGRANRYRWTAKRPAWMTDLDDRERLLLMLAQRHLCDLLPLEVRELVRSKLEAPSHGPQTSPLSKLLRGWPDKVAAVPLLPRLLPPVVDPDVLTHISTALLGDRWLNIAYQNASGRKHHDARVMPLALVQQAERLYLVCRFHGRDDNRHLALHRIASAEATPHGFDRPEFSLERYIESGHFGFGNGERIELKIAVRPHLAGLLRETPLSADQRIAPRDDGASLVSATVVRSEQIRWWIRMHGDAVQLIEPAGLLAEVDSALPAKTPA